MVRSQKLDRSRLCSMGLLLLLALLFVSRAAQAHHSFAAEFNVDDRVEVTGVITDVQWINPHVYLTIQSNTKDGAPETWKIETFPPLWFHKIGMGRANFPMGQTLTISGWRAKDHTNLMWIKTVRFPDGHETVITGDDPSKEAAQK